MNLASSIEASSKGELFSLTFYVYVTGLTLKSLEGFLYVLRYHLG